MKRDGGSIKRQDIGLLCGPITPKFIRAGRTFVLFSSIFLNLVSLENALALDAPDGAVATGSDAPVAPPFSNAAGTDSSIPTAPPYGASTVTSPGTDSGIPTAPAFGVPSGGTPGATTLKNSPASPATHKVSTNDIVNAASKLSHVTPTVGTPTAAVRAPANATTNALMSGLLKRRAGISNDDDEEESSNFDDEENKPASPRATANGGAKSTATSGIAGATRPTINTFNADDAKPESHTPTTVPAHTRSLSVVTPSSPLQLSAPSSPKSAFSILSESTPPGSPRSPVDPRTEAAGTGSTTGTGASREALLGEIQNDPQSRLKKVAPVTPRATTAGGLSNDPHSASMDQIKSGRVQLRQVTALAAAPRETEPQTGLGAAMKNLQSRVSTVTPASPTNNSKSNDSDAWDDEEVKKPSAAAQPAVPDKGLTNSSHVLESLGAPTAKEAPAKAPLYCQSANEHFGGRNSAGASDYSRCSARKFNGRCK